MNPLVTVGLAANTGNFVRGFKDAETATGKFTNSLGFVAQAADTAFEAIKKISFAAIGAGVSIGVSLAGATLAASGLEAGLRSVQSITHDTWGTMQGFGDELVSISREVPQSASEMAKGLYDVASAGFAAADGMMITKQAAIAAAAGETDASIASQAMVGALNAYGMSAKDVVGVSDILFKTVEAGVLRFEDLAVGMGDWVSMAAAAKVPLEDAGAALAAITRAGVQPAEASTALARLLQEFLDPSEKLVGVLEDMGYESGLVALQAEGLQGIMDKLRIATGGSADQVQALFSEIRATKGAFSLMSNEGKTYATVQEQIADKTARAGATQRAFGDQARGAGFQMEILKNNIMANTITIGNFFLPIMRGGLRAINQFVSSFALIPKGMQQALAIGAGVSSVLLTMAGTFGLLYVKSRLVRNGLHLVGITMRGLAAGAAALRLSGLANFFTEASTKGGMLRTTLFAANQGLQKVGFSAKSASFVIGGMGTAIAALTAGWVLYSNAQKNAQEDADELVASLRQQMDLTTPAGMVQGLKMTRTELRGIVDEWNTMISDRGIAGSSNALRLMQNVIPGMDDDVERLERSLDGVQALEAEIVERQQRWKDSTENVNIAMIKLQRNTGDAGQRIVATSQEVTHLARELGVDLGAAGVEGAQGIEKIATEIFNATQEGRRFGTEYGISIGRVITLSEDALKEVQDFSEGVRSTFLGVTDAVSEFQGSIFMKREKGEPPLFDLEDVENFFIRSTIMTREFIDDIDQLIMQGVDPDFVSRLLAAGPEEAGRLADLIADASGDGIRQMIADYEFAFDHLSSRAAESARLTQMAIQDTSDQMTQELPTAMRIAATKTALEAKGLEANVGEVAYAMKAPIEAVESIAGRFGISLEPFVQSFKDAPITKTFEDLRRTISDPVLSEFFDQMAQGGLDLGTLPSGSRLLAALQELAGTTGRSLSDFERMDQTTLFKVLMGEKDIPNAELIIDVIQDFRRARKLERMLRDDGVAQSNINTLMRFATDPSTPQDAMRVIAMMAQGGQLTRKELNLALKLVGSPEAKDVLEQIRTGNRPLKFLIEGEIVDIKPPTRLRTGKGGRKTGTGFMLDPVRIDAVVENADAPFKLREVLQDIDEIDPEVELQDDGSFLVAKERLDDIYAKLHEINTMGIVTSTIEIQTIFAPPQGRTPVPDARKRPTRGIYPANGGIFSFLQEGHVAQMARAGEWRVWAEPETGGEAYIPLSPLKRVRSTAILKTVAGLFGYRISPYAEGGIRPSNDYTNNARPIVVEKHVVHRVEHHYQFNGDIQGVKMEDAIKYANQRQRREALLGG